MRRARRLISAGSFAELQQLIDGHIARLATVIPRIYIAVGEEEVDALAVQLRIRTILRKQDLDDFPANIAFDLTDPVAAEAMRQATLAFIREFTEAQRIATREALSQAIVDRVGTRGAARRFRNSIGLTIRQQAAVANYERLLGEGSAEALLRDLRDHRFDPTVRRAIASGEPLSRVQIDRMVERYRDRYLAYRAHTIARTETLTIISEAREEGLRQALQQTGLSTNVVVRQWRTTLDAKTRDTHRGMDRQSVAGVDTPFRSPSGALLRYPGDRSAPAAERINCRCVVTHEIKKVEAQ